MKFQVLQTSVVTQQPQGTTLRRRSNVDGNFYSHEFDHDEVMEVMSESRSQISSVDEPWNRVFEAPKRVYPTPNGSLRERSPPGARVQDLVEPCQRPNDSLRERSPPGVRVQESAESPSLMDELRQMAAELNRRLEHRIADLRARRSGLTDGLYPVQPVEQGMPPAARPYPNPLSHATAKWSDG